MAHVITAACIDELDGSCVQVCPVDCIYEGARKRYINPTECIDCGACLPECPVDAIYAPGEADVEPWAGNEDAFFTGVLAGRSEPLGEPGGAYDTGRIGADTPLVSGWPGPGEEKRTTP
ncbi:indolepyruvate ferredoxin oxidoreductase subunit alpha [Actinomadura opuntiae]|uniref:indolepyruvate ferredoxin oxidoreductase subunit alpha n=1 Tax=Actinomadura sp. OS1-43 TaxID=604315 RepID=UPI00255ACBA1|nr:ferredoxin family protein [Actinomadura sp. OS1-43]MDL4821797.1 ferredoxin family protein [Actinomadura sp. OS1-43]